MLTIKTKLISLVLTVVVFASILGFLSYMNHIRVKQHTQLSGLVFDFSYGIVRLRNAENDFIANCRSKEEFYITGKCDAITEFHSISKNNKRSAIELINNPLIYKDQQIIDKTNSIAAGFKNFTYNFNNIVLKIWERGSYSRGLFGEWKKQEKDLINKAEIVGNKAVVRMVMSLTSISNHYELYKDEKYIQELIYNVDYIKNSLIGNELNQGNSTEVSAAIENLSDTSKVILLNTINNYSEIIAHVYNKDLDIKESLLELQLSFNDVDKEIHTVTKLIIEKSKASLAEGVTTFNIAALLLAFVMAVILLWVAFSILKPLKRIQFYIMELVQGKLPENIVMKGKDEIASMVNLLNNFVGGLKEKASFADEIGQGELRSDYKPISEEDRLGNALLDMQSSLRKAKEDELERKAEDDKRNWTSRGLAQFSDILRQSNDKLDNLSVTIISTLVKYLDANQGGLYIYYDEDPEDIHLKLVAVYAYNRNKFAEDKIKPGHGLIGTCALEKQTIYLKEVPEEYIKITSGLGEDTPKSLLIVPLKVEDSLMGIVEMASFDDFADFEIEFVENVGKNIAATVSGIKINERTTELLKQSQSQAETMAAQEAKMRLNLQELTESQKKSQRTDLELKELKNVLKSTIMYAEINPDGYYGFVNQHFANYFCLENNKLTGLPIIECSTESGSIINEDLIQELDKGKPVKREAHYKIEGVTQMLFESYTPIFDEADKLTNIILIASAENDEHCNNAASTDNPESGSLYKAINESIAIIEYLPNGDIIRANSIMLGLLGLTSEELQEKNHRDFCSQKELESSEYAEFWKSLKKGIKQEGEYSHKLERGEVVFYEIFSPVLDTDGNCIKVLTIVQEIES